MPRAALLLLVPVLALAACGGDDGPSREDYIAEADALCERLNEEIEPPEELEDEVDKFLDTARDQEQALERARDAGTFEEGAQILRQELPPIVEAREEAADEIGFEECGSG